MIKCPECEKSKFVNKEPMIRLSMPPKQEYYCRMCHHSWYQLAEVYQAKESSNESED